MGCDCCKRLNSRSAGGQLEQPSDVNSSTSTGVRGDSAIAIAADIIIIHQVRIYTPYIPIDPNIFHAFRCILSRASNGAVLRFPPSFVAVPGTAPLLARLRMFSVPGQRLTIDFDSKPRSQRQEPVAAIEFDGLAHNL